MILSVLFSVADCKPDIEEKMDLTNWTIFSLLETDFVSKIKMACVFGKIYFSFTFI